MPAANLSAGGSLPLHPPTGQQVYDALMSQIERELMAGIVQSLEEKYRGETPAEREARYKRYQEALIKYDRAFAEFAGQLRSAVDQCRTQASAGDHGNAAPLETLLGPPSATPLPPGP